MNNITLKACRVNKGLSQKQLADMLGKHESTIVKWEKDPRKIPMGDFKEICDILKVDIDKIFLPKH